MNIPVCVLYQSKQKIKLTYFTKYNKYNFVYFIKVNHDNSMYLHTIKNEIYFKFDELSNKLVNTINTESYDNFIDYLKADIRRK